MGIFPRLNQRSKVLLPIRTNLSEYNEIPELTTISTNMSIPCTLDGPTVVQRYRNLVIGAGATLTTQYRCCGLVLVVDGDLTVNGTISMTARGASFQPPIDHRIKNELLPGNDIFYEIDIPATAEEIADFLKREKRRYRSLDELPAIFRPTLYCRGPHGGVYAPADLGVIPVVGGSGGAYRNTTGAGNPGADGTERRCGGGGSGGCAGGGSSGAGAPGTCYSGGSGGGGEYGGFTNAHAAGFGGTGGAAQGSGSGGAGNHGGSGASSGTAGESGTGGLLIVICTGDVLINSGASILSKGSNSGTGGNCGGGGSGGGSINIFFGDTLENDGVISAAGGIGNAGGYQNGGKGGDGCVTSEQYNF